MADGDDFAQLIAQQVREHLLTMGLAPPSAVSSGPPMEVVYPYGTAPMMAAVPQFPRMLQAGISSAEQRFVANQRLGPVQVEHGLYEPPSVEHAQAFIDMMPPTPSTAAAAGGSGSGSLLRTGRPPQPFPQREMVRATLPSAAYGEREERREDPGARNGRGVPKVVSLPMDEERASLAGYRPRSLGGLEEIMREFCLHRRVVGDVLNHFKYVLSEVQNEYGLMKSYNRDVVAFEHAGHQLLKYIAQGDRVEVPVIQSGPRGAANAGMGAMMADSTPVRPPPPRSVPMGPPAAPTPHSRPGETSTITSGAFRGPPKVSSHPSSGSSGEHRRGGHEVSDYWLYVL